MTEILIDGCRMDAGQAVLLEGLGTALRQRHADWRLTVALSKANALPLSLDGRIASFYIPHARELFWPRLARGFDLFVSLDARLPLLPMPCPMVHAVRDVSSPGRLRLRRALTAARLTWFDSERARQRCEALVGQVLPGGGVRPPEGDDAAWDDRLRDLEAIVGVH